MTGTDELWLCAMIIAYGFCYGYFSGLFRMLAGWVRRLLAVEK